MKGHIFMKKNKYYQNIITIYFAPPRTGKSTFATKIARKCLKRKIPVYSNFYIKDAFKLDKSDLGKFDLHDCKVLIDEVGIEFNNRDFKSFSKDSLSFFKLHGHSKVSVDIFSQGWDDMDKKIRTCAQKLFLIKRSRIPFFCRAIPIYKKIGINEFTKEICDEYYTLPPLLNMIIARWCFMPYYWRFFDSFERPSLPPMENCKWGISLKTDNKSALADIDKKLEELKNNT